MTDLLSDVDTPSDAELISRVRGGDVAAYGDLFSRHKDAANRLARQLVRGPDADDLVAEAFAKVLSVLQGGGGPDVAFRAYLLTAVRRLHVDRIRSGARVQTTDDLAPFDAGVPFQDTAVAGFESGAAAKAFASLPERWQLVLWHLEVEGQKPADIAPLLGMSANSVSALAYRAREGLRQAFLTMHLSDTSAAQCRWVNEHLGAYVRKGLAKRDATKVQTHLDQCRRCTAMYLELTEVNSNLAGIIAPLLLGAAAAGYVSATGGGAGAAGVLSLIGRARDVALANSGAVTAGAVATGVAAAAVATVVVVQVHKRQPDVTANPSPGVTSVLPSSPAASRTTPAASPTKKAAPISSAATPTLSPTPSVSLLPTTGTTTPVLPSTAAVPVGVESSGAPAATETAAPTDTTSPTPTDEPPPTNPPAPTADQPALSADGAVTVTVHDVGASDTVGIRLESTSGRTTWATGASSFPASCAPDGADGTAVQCHPGLSALSGRFAAPAADGGAPGDYAVTLPLDYPDDLIDDQVRVLVSVNGRQVQDSGPLPFHPTHRYDFALADVSADSHTLSRDTDRYELVATLGALPAGVSSVYLGLDSGGSFSGDQPSGCRAVTGGDHAGQVLCEGVSSGAAVRVAVDSTSGSTHDATLRVLASPPFTDPVPDNDTATVHGLQPGTHLLLGPHSLGSLHQDAGGAYPVDLQVSGVRAGVPDLRFTLGKALSFAGTTTDGCAIEGSGLVCTGLTNGAHVGFSVTSPTPAAKASLVVTATPGGDFVDVANDAPDDNTATGSLTAAYDFSVGDLTLSSQSLVDGGTDRYVLHTTVSDRPSGAGPLTITVDGGRFSSEQPDCSYVDGDHVTCPGGPVDLAVESTTTSAHPVTIRLVPPDGYDDLNQRNDSGTTTDDLRPGADLDLAALNPDNESPANDDDTHLIRTRLSGVRAGLDSVTYTLGGNATFRSFDGCTANGRTLTCDSPENGDVTFKIVADDPHQSTRVGISVAPSDPFVKVGDGVVSRSVTLLPRPTYDFAMAALILEGHTVVANTDHYTLGSDVGAVPAGVPGLTFAVAGGTFAAGQDTGCTRVDGTHVTCGDLGSARHIGFRVDSSSTDSHSVAISLQVPPGYDDPDPSDDSHSITVAPGVDLHLGLTSSANPQPNGRTYDVTTVLTGVRNGPVRFSVDGATVADVSPAGCTPVSSDDVRCTGPTVGQRITFTLRSNTPAASTAVRITAASATLQEVDDRDNSAGVTLSPDVVLSSVVYNGEVSTDARVRAQVTGVPAGVDGVRIHLTGEGVGTGGGSVHFTDGPNGANGEGPVGCYTSDAAGSRATVGLWATCYGVADDDDGSFYIDMRLAHPSGTARTVTFTVVPVGVDEGPFDGNNSRALTIG